MFMHFLLLVHLEITVNRKEAEEMLRFHGDILGKIAHGVDVYNQLSNEMMFRNSESSAGPCSRLVRKFFMRVVTFMLVFEDQEVGGEG